jgi:hypothetical protein
VARKRRSKAEKLAEEVERELHALGAYERAEAKARAWRERQAARGQAKANEEERQDVTTAVVTLLSSDNKPASKDNAVAIVDREGWQSLIAARIRSEDYSFNALGAEAGVDPSVIVRFVKGERDIRLATAERLCAALDLVLVPREMIAEAGD